VTSWVVSIQNPGIKAFVPVDPVRSPPAVAGESRASFSTDGSLLSKGLAGVYRSTGAGKLLDCNPAFAAIFGFASPSEMMASPTTDLYLHPGDRAGNLDRLRRLGTIHSGELRMRRRDGTPIWVVYSESLSRAGEEELIEGTMLDITAQRQAEAELHQARRLAAVGALASELAHEVSSPLSAVVANLSYAQQALALLARQSNVPALHAGLEEAGAALRDAVDAATRVTAVIRQLQSQERALAPKVERLDLIGLLDRALKAGGGWLRKRVDDSWREQPAAMVVAEDGPLTHALLDALTHVARALPERGEGVERVQVTVATKAGRTTVTIVGASLNGDQVVPAGGAASSPAWIQPEAHDQGLAAARLTIREAGGELITESVHGHGRSVIVHLESTPPLPGDG
jgi:PAS domain S-box-containing protein